MKGPCFENHVYLMGLRKMRTTLLHPRGNGIIGRMNRTLKNLPTDFVDDTSTPNVGCGITQVCGDVPSEYSSKNLTNVALLKCWT